MVSAIRGQWSEGERESSEDWCSQGELPGGGDTSRWVLKDGRTPLSGEDK